MNESEVFVLIQLIVITIPSTIVLWYSWFKISIMKDRLEEISLKKKGIFYSITDHLQKHYMYALFTLMIFSFPFLFIWALSFMFIPNAVGEIVTNSWFQLVVLLAIVSIALLDRPADQIEA